MVSSSMQSSADCSNTKYLFYSCRELQDSGGDEWGDWFRGLHAFTSTWFILTSFFSYLFKQNSRDQIYQHIFFISTYHLATHNLLVCFLFY